MALRHAVLASLLDGPASGYDLAKRMDISVAAFWHALPSQIYGELAQLEREGLVSAKRVEQDRRPAKRLYTLTEAGTDELAAHTRAQPKPTAIKDELMVQIQAADIGELEAVAEAIDERRRYAEARLAIYNDLIDHYLRGRDEDAFLRTARRIGPYLNLRRGRDFEAENLKWYEWAAAALRARAQRKSPRPTRT
jgi:DNA-binding PadR family transcriptional regulator